MSLPRRALVAAVGTLAAALALAGCGSSATGAAADGARRTNGLVRALNGAIDEVIRNGTYGQVLKRWGPDGEAVPSSEINPPGLPGPRP
ncbi:hypothetical protein ACFU7Y_24905 [Kitasatospora sp. NPDC057542]|uniref:hypothetical protein n=1 Tax=Streptomycetaceae TaxID=2062 RepID=UPI0035A89025